MNSWAITLKGNKTHPNIRVGYDENGMVLIEEGKNTMIFLSRSQIQKFANKLMDEHLKDLEQRIK